MSLSVAELERGDVDADAFGHREHVEMAWRFLTAYGPVGGRKRFCSALIRLTEKLGVPDKYHETVTCFFLDEISRRMDDPDWKRFARNNPDLFDGKALLERYYLSSTIESREARISYLAPDRTA